MTPAPLPPQRRLFEIPDDVAYLNCAYMAPNLASVRVAGEQAVAKKSRPWEIAAQDFFTDSERLRERVANVVHGDADGVALVPSVSYGIGVAAANIPIDRGDRVVVLAEQFPSNVYPWREHAASVGAEIVTVPRPAEGTWTKPVLDALDDRVAAVAIPNCHWTDGSLVNLAEVGDAARAAGAALVVDATQSLGALPLDVGEVQPDFLVAAAYKWLLGPYALAYLWVREDRRAGTPLEFNWITREDSDDFAGLVDYRDGYAPGARRYDMGERSNFTGLPMAIAALDQLLDWTVPAVAATTRAHTGAIETATREMGLDPVPAANRAGHMLGVRFPDGLPADLAERLHDASVHVSVRGDSVRVSPHVWNTAADIDRLLDVVAR